MASPNISVIIPYLNQPEHLGNCLQSLHAQTRAIGDVEFIVVDNGSRELPENICNAYSNVKLVVESEPGPGPARNKGVSVARAQLLAFIDADCIADTNWLSAIVSAFDNPGVQVIGGDVRIAYADPAKLTMLEAYESVYAYRQQEYIEKQGFSGTGNLAMRKAVYITVGPFAGIGVAEDREWGQRAKAVGINVQYIHGMKVFHPARKSMSELYVKWDRHTSHDFEEQASGFLDNLKWIAKASALAISPVWEIFRIFSSDRLNRLQDRALAFVALSRIRFYRSRISFLALVRSEQALKSSAWNRD